MIHIFGGGTITHVRNHLAICAPAYGNTAKKIYDKIKQSHQLIGVELHLTKMADSSSEMETNDAVQSKLCDVMSDLKTKAIIFNVALCDFYGSIGEVESGKYAERLKSRDGDVFMKLTPANKLLSKVKQQRPDIMLVGFKTTAGATLNVQEQLSLRQINESGVDIVFANDTVTRQNCITTKKYTQFEQRDRLIDMIIRDIVEHELAQSITT